MRNKVHKDGTMEKEKKSPGFADLSRGKKIIIISAAAFLCLVLILGAVLGTVTIVKRSRAVVSYKGVNMDEGVVNYLCMMAKYDFITGLARNGINHTDSAAFWSTPSDSGETYGELLRRETETFVRNVAVGSYLFDRNTRLSASDKEIIRSSLEAVLYNYDGDKKALNEAAADLGFDYSDIERGAELIYKYEMAKSVIFGYDASALSGGSFDNECDEFYNSYAYAKLLFIRTNDGYVTDPDTGKKELVELDSTVKADVAATVEKLRKYIDEYVMNAETMEKYLAEWSVKDEMNRTGGYYFANTSNHTSGMRAAYADVIDTVLEQKEYTFSMVDTQWGVCIIYRLPLPTRGYTYPANDLFFGDFYEDAATYIYYRELLDYSSGVKVKDSFAEIDLERLTYNYMLAV